MKKKRIEKGWSDNRVVCGEKWKLIFTKTSIFILSLSWHNSTYRKLPIIVYSEMI